MDQESGRREDAHRAATSAALEKIKRQVAEHPLLVADNERLRALLLRVSATFDPDSMPGDGARVLDADIRAALKAAP
jgi:hypothetical protein